MLAAALKIVTREADDEMAAAHPLVPLADHPQYTAESAILTRLGAEIANLDREIAAVEAAAYLRQVGRDAAPAFVRDGSEIALALQIIEGKDVDLRSDAERLATARSKLERLRPGYSGQRARLEQLRERLSAQACRGMAQRHRKALINILESARALARAAAAERAIHAELVAGGYLSMPHILPAPELGALLALEESFDSSQLSHYRRQLERLGVIANG